MTVLITLTTAGSSTGPFSLYSNVDSYSTPFETGVSRSSLLAGYTSTVVPNGTTIVRVMSTGTCTNYTDISVVPCTTTTTTTVPPPTTTTTTTSSTYYYYVIREYNCANSCSQVSPDLVGRSSTPLSTVDGLYYKLSTDPNVYQVINTAETTVWDINLDGAVTNANCGTACTL